MNALRRLLLHDWPAKLAALGLATVLYAGVSLSEATRTWSAPVTIEVLGAPDGGALLEAPGVVDRIEYQAAGDVADQLTNDSFRASIDLSGVQPHAGAEPVTVPVDVFPVDPRVRVTGYSPPGVSVRLDEVVSRVRPVVIDPGVVPEGIELGPIIAQPNQATLRGAASRLQNVRSVEGRFVVDASGINIDQDVTLEAFDELGAVVPGIEIEPADRARECRRGPPARLRDGARAAGAHRRAGARQARGRRVGGSCHRHRQRRERRCPPARVRLHGAARHQRAGGRTGGRGAPRSCPRR